MCKYSDNPPDGGPNCAITQCLVTALVFQATPYIRIHSDRLIAIFFCVYNINVDVSVSPTNSLMGRRVTCLDALACYRVDDRGMEGRGLRGGCSWTSFATLTAPHLIFCWPWGQHSPLLTVVSVIFKIQIKVQFKLQSTSVPYFILAVYSPLFGSIRNGSSEKKIVRFICNRLCYLK